jgi:hypothetical protein
MFNNGYSCWTLYSILLFSHHVVASDRAAARRRASNADLVPPRADMSRSILRAAARGTETFYYKADRLSEGRR